MATFNLTKNAFALLGTSARANRAQLEDAYHDALLEAEDHNAEAVLNRAQQSLISPRDRLESELGYFIVAKPATAKTIIASLKNGSAAISEVSLAGLDLINLSAHLCGVGSPQQQFKHASQLIEAYDALEFNEVADALNALRSVSGFGPVAAAQVRSALNRLRVVHARAALDAILANHDGVEHLAALAEELSSAGTARRAFLESLLQVYEARIAPDLGHAATKVRDSLAAVNTNPENDHLVTALAADLRAWDKLAQPLQNADRARGIDEHHSRELFGEIRQVCLSFANERGLYSQALAISEIAAQVFSELPDAADKLEEDIEALSDLSSEKAKAELLAPLGNAVSDAEGRHSATCAGLRKAGFSANAPSPVREVHGAFASLIRMSNDVELNGMGASLVRNLGIELCNESNDNHAAMAIVTGLLKHRPSLPVDVIKALEGDCKTLQRNIDFNAMTDAMKLGQLDEADRLAEGMLEGADTETRGILLGVRSAIVERKKARKRKLIGWGVFAAIILFIIIANDNSNSGASYDTSASTNYDQAVTTEAEDAAAVQDEQSQEAAGADPVGAGEAAAADVSQAETPPEPDQTYRTVSLSELRYCKRQKARLEVVQNEQMSNPQIDRFNSAIEDYNSRCGSFRYRQTDMDAVDMEVANDQATIRAEAQDIIGSEQ
ncbi:MAG: hypothetical protein KME20_22070 [Kaiparowitsia implicata GSE-PSE-MK54-09C]|nr:hypothetical protein [Kaiparowitsia implicata GSE-PSE-MK54-09C]